MKNVTKERALVLRKALVELHNSCPDDTKTQDLIDDLLNGQNVTYMAQASELKEQNRELVEAKNAMVECSAELFRLLLKYCPPDNKELESLKELLTKHQKDV